MIAKKLNTRTRKSPLSIFNFVKVLLKIINPVHALHLIEILETVKSTKLTL